MKALKIYYRFLPLISSAILLWGCEKNEGKIYLRVVNLITTHSEITVGDKEKVIPADGKYHLVNSFVETEFKLLNVTWDSVTNWNTACYLDPIWYKDITVSRFFGEFERLPGDSYYTLTLKYKIEYSKPFKYIGIWFKDYDIIRLTYKDNSTLIYSPTE
jgi:hypothetical protein